MAITVDDQDTVTLDAPCGRLAGLRKAGVSSFKGIPFAEPPVGPRRWLAPERAKPWSGMRDATRFSAVCPQAPTALEGIMGATLGEQSEDCLYLNVWTPDADARKRPVMVWFHGGAFILGAGSQGIYNGKYLAKRGDVVIVTANYRLGGFGFLNLRDATDGKLPGTGSEGLLDQIAALEWVRDNIASFGGDPNNVTIFGESAGGMSVASLLASPKARGLFQKAIPQSGAAHVGYSREKSARVGRAFLDELKIDPKNTSSLMDLPYGALIKAQMRVLGDARDGDDTKQLGRMPFQPVIDGEVLSERPIDAIRNGSAANIPVLVGTTRDEWRLFTAIDPRVRLMLESGLEKRVRQSFGEDAGTAILAAYKDGSSFDRWNTLMTDRVFRLPAIRLAEAQRKHTGDVFSYRFDWRSPLMGGAFRACHAVELGFMWGTHGSKLVRNFFGDGQQAEAVSSAMMDAWIAFARTGNPTTAATGPWLAYGDQRPVMVFSDSGPTSHLAPDDEMRRAWDSMPDKALGT